MANSDFESKTKQDSTDAVQKSSFTDSKKSTDGHPKTSFSTSKQRQKKTGVALSVITCLFMCVLGYEIIRENQTADDNEADAANPEKKPLQILGREDGSAPMPVLTAQGDGPHSYDTYQIKLLVEQNRLQAEKIKQLRDELLSTTQRLHDIKPNLFTKSNSQDIAKIADLTQRLAESEDVRVQMSQLKETLEQETRESKKKLAEMSVIKDSLAAMVESLRSGREQEQQQNIKQIEELRFTTSAEKNALVKKIQQHEQSIQKLTQLIDEKTKFIGQLDQDVQKQNILLAFKSEELQDLQQQMLVIYENILLQTNVSEILHDKMATEARDLAVNLQSEQERTSQLLAKNEEIGWLVDIFDLSQKMAYRDTNDLITALEWESAKNHELNRLKQELLDLKLEMHQLSDTYALSKAQMNERVQDIVAALQIEELYNRELAIDNSGLKRLVDEKLAAQLHLEGELQTLSSAIKQEKERVGELQHELFVALMHHENENNYSGTLQDKITEHLAANSQLQETVQSLQSAMKSQQDRNADLQQKYFVSLLHHDEESTQTAELEQQIQRNVAHQHELQNSIAALQTNMEQHSKAAEELQHRLALAQEQHEQDHMRAVLVEQQLQKTTAHKDEMEEMVIQLQATIEKHEQRGSDLLDELLVALVHHEEENSYVAELERQIQDNQQTHNQLHQTMVQTQQTIEKQNQLVAELQQKLDLNKIQADGQDKNIASLLQKVKENEAEQVFLTDMIEALGVSLETEAIHNQSLKADLASAADHDKFRSRQISDLEAVIQSYLAVQGDLKESLAQKQKSLEAEQERALEAQRNYHEALGIGDVQLKQIQELEAVIEEHLAAQSALKTAIAAFEKDLNSQEQRARDLEEKLLTALAHHESENRYAVELEQLIEESRASHAAMQETVYNMTMAIDREKQKSEELQHQLLVAQSHHDAESKRAADLEARLQENDAARKNELDLAQQRHENKERQLAQQLQTLLESYQTEQQKSLALEMLIQDTAKNVQELELALEKHQSILTGKHEELSILAQKHTDKEKEFYAKLEALNKDFGTEKERSKEIQENLEYALVQYDQAKEKAEILERQLKELSHELSQKDQDYHSIKQQLSQVSHEHQQLRSHHKELAQEKGTLEERYILELHKILVQDDLMRKLQEDLDVRNAALDQVTRLKEELSEQNASVEKKRKELEALLNKEIASKNAYNEEVQALKAQLEEQQLQTKNLEMHLSHLQNLHREEQENLANLEQIQGDTVLRLEALQEELISHRDTIAAKNLEIQTLHDAKSISKASFKKQQEIILKELESERNRAKGYQDELDKTLALYKQEQKKAHELEQKTVVQQQTVKDHEQLKGKLNVKELKSITQQVELTALDQHYNGRIKELEEKLRQMKLVIQQKEEAYKSLANRLAEHQTESKNYSSKQQEVSEKRFHDLQDKLQQMAVQVKNAEEAHQSTAEKIAKLAEQNRQLQEEKDHALVEKANIEQKYLKELKGMMQQATVNSQPAQSSAESQTGSAPNRQTASVASGNQAAGQRSRTHIVAEGDTLRSISKTYYGTPNRWRMIFQANRDKIPDENRLRKGTQLIIPSIR